MLYAYVINDILWGSLAPAAQKLAAVFVEISGLAGDVIIFEMVEIARLYGYERVEVTPIDFAPADRNDAKIAICAE